MGFERRLQRLRLREVPLAVSPVCGALVVGADVIPDVPVERPVDLAEIGRQHRAVGTGSNGPVVLWRIRRQQIRPIEPVCRRFDVDVLALEQRYQPLTVSPGAFRAYISNGNSFDLLLPSTYAFGTEIALPLRASIPQS